MSLLNKNLVKLAALTLACQLPQALFAERALAQKPSLDVRKTAIESNLKSIIKTPNLTKLLTKKSLSKKPGKKTIALKEVAPLAKSSTKVSPGKVVWHKNMKRASQAALLSQKPILVFHLMGKLDDRYT